MKYEVIMVLLLILTACGTETARRDTEAVDPDPYGDPPGYSGDPFAGYGPLTSVTLPAPGSAATLWTSSGLWSVQIAACATEDAALTLRDRIESLDMHPVFIDHIGSYYKVRVGSFETSDDSAALRNELRNSGYPDAWSVERAPTP